MSPTAVQQKTFIHSEMGKINRKIDTLSLYAAHTQVKIIKMHLTACRADLTEHKCTVLLCCSGGMEEG